MYTFLKTRSHALKQTSQNKLFTNNTKQKQYSYPWDTFLLPGHVN